MLNGPDYIYIIHCNYPCSHKIQDYLFLSMYCLFQKARTFKHNIWFLSTFLTVVTDRAYSIIFDRELFWDIDE